MKNTNTPKTEQTSSSGSESAPCSLMPVNFGDETIMVDVSPLTVDEFKQWAIGEIESHIERGKQMFPFITANTKELRQRVLSAAQPVQNQPNQ